jgi:hypothetical protein
VTLSSHEIIGVLTAPAVVCNCHNPRLGAGANKTHWDMTAPMPRVDWVVKSETIVGVPGGGIVGGSWSGVI